MMYGYYSVQARKFGVHIYLTPEGEKIEVTAIGKSENPKDDGYLWEDAVMVGQVDETKHLYRTRADFLAEWEGGNFR